MTYVDGPPVAGSPDLLPQLVDEVVVAKVAPLPATEDDLAPSAENDGFTYCPGIAVSFFGVPRDRTWTRRGRRRRRSRS